MNEDLKRVYRALGYTGALPEAGRITRGGTAQPEKEKLPEFPPLDEQGLGMVENLLKAQPGETAALLSTGLKLDLSDEETRSLLAKARSAFDNPAAFLEDLEKEKKVKRQEIMPGKATRGVRGAAAGLPNELRQYPDILVDPPDIKLEPKNDALGWVFNCGMYWVRDKLKISYQKAPFPFHHAFASNFTYRMKDRNGKPLDAEQKTTIALFADFGSGIYHSKYIAKKIAEIRPHYAIHLGDVYYSGRFSEFKNNFREPLDPVLKTSRVFAMNGNHEMYSGAFPYFDYINYKRNTREGWVEQEQEGSYFCLWNEKYQLIGLDTAFHEDGRHRNETVQEWLGKRLREGKQATPKRTNILLSPNEPYELGKEHFGDMYRDLKTFIRDGLIDFWFWGNTHYAALYDRSQETPFMGSCVGHGGHPVYREEIEKDSQAHEDLLKKQKPVAPIIWVDLSTRFPQHTGLRPELGNNGFCIMEIEDDSIHLTYCDWLGNKQFEWANA
jgi:hypothetical protein